MRAICFCFALILPIVKYLLVADRSMNSRLVDHARKSLSPLKNKVAKQRKIFKSPLLMILNSVLIERKVNGSVNSTQ